ncbi:hypothetical protein BDQ12DRAFT_760384 [Crucibulum laeve]|uniref:BTB domain-containing protein n=1 Tax=Crucibulum laeve TaxID=68775 RepID=A0A5C3LQ14_9AGAR|nr:hypothetical protein BDQ12DRAFT_760384 [Crucibulum laeve]
MRTTKLEDTPGRFHPIFNSSDADIVLHSREGTYYRVSSCTLRNTTGFFRQLISQNGNERGEHIPIDETDSTLERVLRMTCGLETPQWKSFDELEDTVTLIEKWDAAGPLSVIRSAIFAPLFLTDPLRLYALVTRFGWEEEIKLASTYTLPVNLYDDQHQKYLEKLSSRYLLSLLRLHKKRRDEFKKLIDSEEIFSAGNAVHANCMGCGEDADNHTWRELKARMFVEMDRRPLGDTLCGLDMEEWPEAIACWEARCTKEGCGRLNYSKIATLRDVMDCVGRLPFTI